METRKSHFSPKEEYRAGLEGRKNHLHGCLILLKGDIPTKVADLRSKLLSLWKSIGSWSMVSLGKGFYEFSFSSPPDLRNVLSIGSWSLKPGILHLSSWTPDFNPYTQKQTHANCWVCIIGLPQEYWRAKIFFCDCS